MSDNRPGEVQRSLESGGNLFLNKFWTGIYQNRSPLFTPISVLGIQLVARQDALIDGENLQLTPQFTLRRRYGFQRSCTSAFGSSEWPLAYFSFEELNGTVLPLVDTQTNIYSFTSSVKTSIYTKAGGAGQTSFNSVGNTLYFCDGVSANKWNGTTVSKMGIVPPISAPTRTGVFGGTIQIFTGWQYVYCYTNSSTGHVSTASPACISTGALANVTSITVQGAGSTDPQVDFVQIYRTADGGAQFYFVAEIANTGTWSYSDTTADANLNTFIIAPVAGVNNPPPAGMSLLTWYAGRLWGVSGNVVYFSAGPDATNGVGAECWPSGNNFTVPGDITAVAPLSIGLVLFTKDTAFIITGQVSPFAAPNTWQTNFGVASQNSLAQDLDNLFLFTTRGQVYSVSTSSGVTEIGFNEEAQLAAFNPSKVYVVLHRSGPDEGVFIADGNSNIYRYSQLSKSWDTVIQPVGGVGAIASIELTSANWRLMAGRPTGSGFILNRDLNTWSDDGQAYPAFGTIGSITVAPPRQVANIESVLTQITAVGTYPTISVMLNEITDNGQLPSTFVALPNPVPDPPQLAGSKSVWTRRHDLKAGQSPLPLHVQHLQIKVSFPSEAQPNEVLGIGIAHKT